MYVLGKDEREGRGQEANIRWQRKTRVERGGGTASICFKGV
jgi:hypothetical protein